MTRGGGESGARQASAPPSIKGLFLQVAGLGLATVASVIAFNGNIAFAAVPLVLFLAVQVLLRLPLRIPALALMFIALTFENPAEIMGEWKSPLFPLGVLLLAQLKQSIPIGALVFTGIDLIIMVLTGVYFHRRTTGSKLDVAGSVPLPRPIFKACLAMIGIAAVAWIWGLARGGSNRFAIWQFYHSTHLALIFLFLQAVIPGPAQFRTMGKIALAAACVKAVLAIFLRAKFPHAEYATTHHDSMLFAVVTCMLLIQFVEAPTRKNLKTALLFLPLLIWGMVANDRRLVWMEIAIAAIFIFVLTPWKPLKIKLTRGVLYAIPVLLVYLVAGWSSSSKIFAPVATIRSMVDSDADKSSEWRDLENFNLVSTLKNNPITGAGWGHPFELAVHLPDVASVYELEPYLPHNSVLGLWANMGFIGFTVLWMHLAVGCYFAARTYRLARDPTHRTAALTAFCMFVIYMVHLYGDLALGTWTSIWLVAMSLVVVGKLSVVVGAWPGSTPGAGGSTGPAGSNLTTHPGGGVRQH